MDHVNFSKKLNFFIVNYYQATCIAIGVLWLILLNSLMITDVWDETNALVILSSEPILSASIFESVRMIWLQELPLDIYRPIGSSLFMVLGKLSGGSFVFLRYVNALFILAAAYMFSSALNRRSEDAVRAIAFYTIMLFSASALITAEWFANIFDASCLFFLAIATRSYSSKNYIACAVAMVLSIFCKEIYVLAIPFLFLAISQAKDTNKKAIALVAMAVIIFSAIYWFVRQGVAPLGSEADIHGFSTDTFFSSSLSFVSGFWFQFSKFTQFSSVMWIGLIVVVASIVAIKSTKTKLTIISILLMSTFIYWEMFGFQGTKIITSNNFVGRLYLVPFALILYLVCKEASKEIILLISVFSFWGMATTYRDHTVFQNTYSQIYELATENDEQVIVHHPEKPLIDESRNLIIGDFPESALRINVENGGLE